MDKTTRQKNKEAREAKRAARAEEEQKDKTLVLDALRAVLSDPEATTGQRLYAVAVLDNMQRYHFAPYGMKYPGEMDIASFRDALLERDKAENK